MSHILSRALHDPLLKELATSLHKAADVDSSISFQIFYNSLIEPPDLSWGDLAFACFPLAKEKKLAPQKIAEELAKKVDSPLVERLEAKGPYLNIFLKPEVLFSSSLAPILDFSVFTRKITLASQRVMIEFSQPNTHKELHVGHMRNLCLGDALVRLNRHVGVDVVSSTFPGDMGTHVAKCLWYLKYRNQEPIPAHRRGEWLGKMYSAGHIALEEEKGSAKEAENRERLTEILQSIESKSGEFYDLWLKTRAWSIELMQETYAWAGVTFDKWYWESEVDAASVALVKKWFGEGKLVQSQGAIGLDLEADGLGFCLLLKSDGTGLYATKDLELARRKFEEMDVEKSLYVVDQRQALHFKQVFKTLEKLGFKQAKDCFHLQYNFVELPDGAMSSRKGNIIPISQLITQMQDYVESHYLQRYIGDWSEEEIKSAAVKIAQGAIKYGMLRMDTNKKIVFDMAEWLKLDGESGPFIQYSCARVKSLLRKLSPAGGPVARVAYDLLRGPSERALALKLAAFSATVLQAAESLKPHLLCTYLYDVAKLFNAFYHDSPIGAAGQEDLKNARLALAQATGIILERGLGLLGIPVPERM